MRLRSKLVKGLVAAGVLTSICQFGSCSVSPELVNSLVSSVLSQVQQSGALDNLQSQYGNLNLSNLQNGPGSGPHVSN